MCRNIADVRTPCSARREQAHHQQHTRILAELMELGLMDNRAQVTLSPIPNIGVQ